MKSLKIKILIASLLVTSMTLPVCAARVTTEEALTVANNWVTLIIHHKGDWGGFNSAYVEEIREFRHGQRTLGYFCRVSPRGHIIVSLSKELAPVKAYSAKCDMNPDLDKGVTAVIKGGIESVIRAIEKQLGSLDSVRTEQLQGILEVNYRSSWDKLLVNCESFETGLESGVITMNYEGGDPPLLSTSWKQSFPYNANCPPGDSGCISCSSTAIEPPTHFPTAVGCTAIAGAQVMKYWNWPPYGVGSDSYDWDGDDTCEQGETPGAGAKTLSATFSDAYEWHQMACRWCPVKKRWEDENGNPEPQATTDAVAELCYEVGVALEMDYGVCGSTAFLSFQFDRDLEDAIEDYFRFHNDVEPRNRQDFTQAQWFDLIKSDLNLNRPIPYQCRALDGLHVIVVDGWQVIGSQAQYHMNYGWDGGVDPTDPDWAGITNSNTWYALDELPGSNFFEEKMLINVYPKGAVGSEASGTHVGIPGNFNYFYFDVDATTIGETSFSNYNLQFLPRVLVSSVGGYTIEFRGYDETRLFSIKGTQFAGCRIYDGAVKLYTPGSIKFY